MNQQYDQLVTKIAALAWHNTHNYPLYTIYAVYWADYPVALSLFFGRLCP